MRWVIIASFLFMVNLTLVFARPADNFQVRSHTTTNGTLPYRLFVPRNYSAMQQYPLILTLHGSAEKGTDNLVQITTNRLAEVWAEDSNQARNQCFVVSPQCPAAGDWSVSGMAMKISLSILDSLKREFTAIDTNRLYITGISMGGMGTWSVIQAHPTMFTAAIPMSGSGNTAMANLLIHLPIWDFHGAVDASVNVSGSRNMINAIVAAGATVIRFTCNYITETNANISHDSLAQAINYGATLLYTEYTDGGHAIWAASYNNPLLYSWLFSKSKIPPDTKYPIFSRVSSEYTDSVTVAMTAGTGVSIRYTTDGSTPTASSALYSAPLTFRTDVVLMAAGFLSGAWSAVDSARYTIIHHVAQPAHNGLQYKYYEYDAPVWDSLKNFSTAAALIKSGMTDSFCVGMKNRNDRFAVHLSGVIKIDNPGDYTFTVFTDAGARLYIDDYCVVNDDGHHLFTASKSGSIQLSAGNYPISLDYFQDTANANLVVAYQGAAMTTRIPIPHAVLFCDSIETAVQESVFAERIIAPDVWVSNQHSGLLMLSIPFNGSYILRIMRLDGKSVVAIRNAKPAIYTISPQDLMPGVYLLKVESGRQTESKIILLNR